MYGWKERKWWLFALTFFVISWWNFDYSSNGIFLMLVFYLCRNNPVVGAMFYLLFTVPPALFARPGDFRKNPAPTTPNNSGKLPYNATSLHWLYLQKKQIGRFTFYPV